MCFCFCSFSTSHGTMYHYGDIFVIQIHCMGYGLSKGKDHISVARVRVMAVASV